MDEGTKWRFMKWAGLFEKYGYEVYNPWDYYEGRIKTATKDFPAMEKARVGFFITDRVSLGTMIEIGYMVGKGKPVIVYLYGDQGYKGKPLLWQMKYAVPTCAKCHVTDNEEVAFKDVIAHLEGKEEYTDIEVVNGRIVMKCKICGTKIVL